MSICDASPQIYDVEDQSHFSLFTVIFKKLEVTKLPIILQKLKVKKIQKLNIVLHIRNPYFWSSPVLFIFLWPHPQIHPETTLSVPLPPDRELSLFTTELRNLHYFLRGKNIMLCLSPSLLVCMSHIETQVSPDITGHIYSPFHPSLLPPHCSCTWNFQVVHTLNMSCKTMAEFLLVGDLK